MTAPTGAFADTVKMAQYIVNHAKAGRDDSDPAVLTDLDTFVRDAHRVIYSHRPPASIDDRLSWLISETAHQGHQLEQIMATVSDVDAAVATLSTDVQGAFDRVAALQAQVTAAQAAQAAAEATAAQATADLATAQQALADAQAAAAADATALDATLTNVNAADAVAKTIGV